MRKANRLVLGLALCGALAATGGVSEAWDPATLAANGAKVADYALAHPTRANHRDWTYGTFYAGLTAFALAHPERPYLDILRQEGTNNAWRLDGGRPFYAETHGIGQTWLELARVDDDPAAAAPTRAVFDYILENRSRAPVVQRLPNGSFSPNLLRWAWSDALFMSPPVWAKLAALTGEARYRDFLIGEYRASAARLYDREAGLFYRDYAARAKRSAHGAPVFWGRGNGWVLGGLPLVLRELPPGLRTRPFFLDLFRGMSEKVKALQRADGAWSPNLLDGRDPDLPEMSATALFCFALAWGVNGGLLDEAEYLPCVRRAWGALCRAVAEEGTLGWVQQAAVGPSANFGADSTALYAVGGYLLAATEIRKYVVQAAHRDAPRVTVGAVRPPPRRLRRTGRRGGAAPGRGRRGGRRARRAPLPDDAGGGRAALFPGLRRRGVGAWRDERGGRGGWSAGRGFHLLARRARVPCAACADGAARAVCGTGADRGRTRLPAG